MHKPIVVIHLREVLTVVIESPAALGAVQDERAAISAQSRMKCPSITRISRAATAPTSVNSSFARRKCASPARKSILALRRLQIIVHQPPDLVFELVMRDAVRARKRREDPLPLCLNLLRQIRDPLSPTSTM